MAATASPISTKLGTSPAHADDPVIRKSGLARPCPDPACGDDGMPRLKRGMTTREVADRGLSLAKGCLAPAELSTCLHPLGFVWPTVVLFISKHCFHYRFAGWLCSRKSWLRLRK